MTKTRFTIYRAKDGWRWRAKRKGRIVCESGEAYSRKIDLRKTLKAFVKSIENGEYLIL